MAAPTEAGWFKPHTDYDAILLFLKSIAIHLVDAIEIPIHPTPLSDASKNPDKDRPGSQSAKSAGLYCASWWIHLDQRLLNGMANSLSPKGST